jgi:transposase-like protein
MPLRAEPGPETLLLAGERCRVHEHEDGRIELRHQGQLLPCRVFIEPEPRVRQADIVANKRLGAVLAQIQKDQQEGDRRRFAGRKLNLRQKERIRTNDPLERVMKEIRRRTRVVGAFPDGHSALMLAAARLRHIQATRWGARRCLDMTRLREAELSAGQRLADVG